MLLRNWKRKMPQDLRKNVFYLNWASFNSTDTLCCSNSHNIEHLGLGEWAHHFWGAFPSWEAARNPGSETVCLDPNPGSVQTLMFLNLCMFQLSHLWNKDNKMLLHKVVICNITKLDLGAQWILSTGYLLFYFLLFSKKMSSRTEGGIMVMLIVSSSLSLQMGITRSVQESSNC